MSFIVFPCFSESLTFDISICSTAKRSQVAWLPGVGACGLSEKLSNMFFREGNTDYIPRSRGAIAQTSN